MFLNLKHLVILEPREGDEEYCQFEDSDNEDSGDKMIDLLFFLADLFYRTPRLSVASR